MAADVRRLKLIIMEVHYSFVGEAATDVLIRRLILEGFSLHLGASGQSGLRAAARGGVSSCRSIQICYNKIASIDRIVSPGLVIGNGVQHLFNIAE